jgi:hypothetical protein
MGLAIPHARVIGLSLTLRNGLGSDCELRRDRERDRRAVSTGSVSGRDVLLGPEL